MLDPGVEGLLDHALLLLVNEGGGVRRGDA